MVNETDNIFALAQQEISENGVLSFPTRRKLWLAFGPWEVRAEDDPNPRTLTEPLKKRAELALACARKVNRVWSAYNSEDKRPQKLIKETRAYLDGKRTAQQLSKAGEEMSDFMSIVDEESDSSAPGAGMAAWDALITALHDEPLLEERYADAEDSDLDSYDWDAAREASEAWAGADEEAGPGKRKVRRMKFWAWYLEEAARLLGDEEYRFPLKAVKAFQEKQNPPRPVPEDVTLESLADYLGVGDLQYCCRILNKRDLFEDKESVSYHIVTRRPDKGGICPKCKTMTSQIKYYIDGNALEGDLPGNIHFMVVEKTPFFQCPTHKGELINAPYEYVNCKALYKRYIAGTGRAETLRRQIEERAIFRFEVKEYNVILNDRALDHFSRHVLKAVPGLEWTNREDDSFTVDLSAFGPHVVFCDLSYEEFVKKYPRRVRQAGEHITEIDFDGVWVRCYLDEKDALTRVETINRFRVQIRDAKRDKQNLALGLKALGMAKAQELAEDMANKERDCQEMECLSGLSSGEAKKVLHVLRKCGVECRIMPWSIERGGDTW